VWGKYVALKGVRLLGLEFWWAQACCENRRDRRRSFLPDGSHALIGRNPTASGCGRMYELRITVILHSYSGLCGLVETHDAMLIFRCGSIDARCTNQCGLSQLPQLQCIHLHTMIFTSGRWPQRYLYSFAQITASRTMTLHCNYDAEGKTRIIEYMTMYIH
jgi:hypothetical protein